MKLLERLFGAKEDKGGQRAACDVRDDEPIECQDALDFEEDDAS